MKQLKLTESVKRQYDARPKTLPANAFFKSTFINGTILRNSGPQLMFLDMANRDATMTSTANTADTITWVRK